MRKLTKNRDDNVKAQVTPSMTAPRSRSPPMGGTGLSIMIMVEISRNTRKAHSKDIVFRIWKARFEKTKTLSGREEGLAITNRSDARYCASGKPTARQRLSRYRSRVDTCTVRRMIMYLLQCIVKHVILRLRSSARGPLGIGPS